MDLKWKVKTIKKIELIKFRQFGLANKDCEDF